MDEGSENHFHEKDFRIVEFVDRNKALTQFLRTKIFINRGVGEKTLLLLFIN